MWVFKLNTMMLTMVMVMLARVSSQPPTARDRTVTAYIVASGIQNGIVYRCGVGGHSCTTLVGGLNFPTRVEVEINAAGEPEAYIIIEKGPGRLLRCSAASGSMVCTTVFTYKTANWNEGLALESAPNGTTIAYLTSDDWHHPWVRCEVGKTCVRLGRLAGWGPNGHERIQVEYDPDGNIAAWVHNANNNMRRHGPGTGATPSQWWAGGVQGFRIVYNPDGTIGWFVSAHGNGGICRGEYLTETPPCSKVFLQGEGIREDLDVEYDSLGNPTHYVVVRDGRLLLRCPLEPNTLADCETIIGWNMGWGPMNGHGRALAKETGPPPATSTITSTITTATTSTATVTVTTQTTTSTTTQMVFIDIAVRIDAAASILSMLLLAACME